MTSSHDTATDRNGLEISPFRDKTEATSVQSAKASDTRWLPWHVALKDLPREKEWAKSLRFKNERKNALRNPSVDSPVLFIPFQDCVTAGATEADMEALHKLSLDEIAGLRMQAAAIRKDSQRQVDEMARRMANGRDAVPPPEPIILNTLLAEADEDDDAQYRLDSLLPRGGRALLAAPYKKGKSTMVGDAVEVLVDGGKFLGQFAATPVSKVVLIDTELDRRTLRRWLRDKGIRNTEAVSVVSLRGAVSSFDIIDPIIRSRWAGKLAGADVVILDCLRPVLDALGLSEDKDAGKVLVAFDALLAEIGASEGLVVTHMGHQNGPAKERARGDSRLLDWPDALWKIVSDADESGDGSASTFFTAFGRDVAVPEGRLTYDAATRHLTYEGGSRRETASRAAVPELLAMVAAAPGKLSKRAAVERLQDDHSIARYVARQAVDTAVKDCSLVIKPGPRRAQMLFPAGDPSPLSEPILTASDGSE